jgi:cathepsin B
MGKVERREMRFLQVEAVFFVFSDFMAYKTGVYSRSKLDIFNGEPEGHAVKVLGWGTDAGTGTDYWLVANSWSPEFGEDGFFRIKRGVNECGIESTVAAGMPLIHTA